MGILLNRGSSSTPSSHLGAPGSATGTSSSSAENNHMDHNTPNHSTRSPGPSQQTPRQLFHYPNPHNLTAETVAALPPPGQSGPSTFTFSPGSRYLSFLSSTHGNISPSPSFHHGQNMSPAPNSRLRSMSNVGMVNTNGERRLCCIDMDKNNGYNQNVHGQVFSLLDSSTLEISETGDSQLSLEERLRRERQRLHATGVTQFSWSTVSPSPHDIKNVNNNAATGEKGLSNVSIYKGSQFNIKGTVQTSTSSRGTTEVLLHDPDSDEREGIEGTKVEEPRMKNDVNMSYDNNNKNMDEDENLRILIPLRGNIYVQDGIGAPLRLIYDKNTSLNNVFLSNPNSESNGNTTKQNRRNSGSAIGRDNGAIDPQLSPDGTMVAFVVAGEIYVIDASSHPKQQTKISSDLNGNCTDKPSSARVPVRITFGASNIGDDNDPHHSCITHGLADFVAQEEMDRYRGFWWNPTSDGIVFTKVDETDVPPYRINHQGRDGTGSSTYEDHRYPFAGEQNPKVSLGFISVDRQIIVNEDAQQAKKSWVHDVKWLDSPSMADEYLARVCFLPDGCVCAQWQNRAQDTLVMVRTDVYTGESSILLTETTHVWINLHHMLRILPAPISPYPNLKNTLPKGSFSFLFASERSGYSHLYLYTYIGGSKKEAILIRAVSAGKWVVENIVGVNMNKNLVYVTGTFDSPLERHLYSLPIVDVDDNKNKSTDIENSSASRLRIKAVFDSLTGNIDSSPIPPPKPTRLTIDRGMHSVVMDKYCKYVVDTSSDLRRPSSVKVFAVEDTLKLLFVLHDVAGHDDKAGSAIGNSYAPPELISFKTSDDTEELHAAVYLPDPKVSRKKHICIIIVQRTSHHCSHLTLQFVVFRFKCKDSWPRSISTYRLCLWRSPCSTCQSIMVTISGYACTAPSLTWICRCEV